MSAITHKYDPERNFSECDILRLPEPTQSKSEIDKKELKRQQHYVKLTIVKYPQRKGEKKLGQQIKSRI